MGVLADVDRQVGVEGLKLPGQEVVGQRVDAVRAPVEPGPLQQVESGKRRVFLCVQMSSKVTYYTTRLDL